MALGPMLSALLDRYGLGSLKEWASQVIIQGLSDAELTAQLYDRPEFQTRFPAIIERDKAGLSPLSVDEYLSYEATARQVANNFGVNITQDEINRNLAGDVSAKELEDRIGLAAAAVYQSPPETRENLTRLYGVGVGDMIRYWLDPREQKPVLQKRFAAAQIAGEAQRSTFGQLSAPQAERLVEGGLDAEAARTGFGQLVETAELFEATDETEADIGMDRRLGALLGEQDVIGEVEKRAAKRKGYFEAGGGFSTGRTGVSGLGSANR